MKTSIEEKLEILWLPPIDELNISEHTKDSVRNPMPSKMQRLDYYVEKDWWQRRYILRIEWNSVYYAYYYLEDYHFGNDGKMVNWKLEKYPINSWYWEYAWTGCCTKAHIRNWSQK